MRIITVSKSYQFRIMFFVRSIVFLANVPIGSSC